MGMLSAGDDLPVAAQPGMRNQLSVIIFFVNPKVNNTLQPAPPEHEEGGKSLFKTFGAPRRIA
jgi:hypothetical protein